jgi:hypothetical protein
MRGDVRTEKKLCGGQQSGTVSIPKLQKAPIFPQLIIIHELTRASPSARRHVLRCRPWLGSPGRRRSERLNCPTLAEHASIGINTVERTETATCVPVPHAGSRPGPYPGKTQKFIAAVGVESERPSPGPQLKKSSRFHGRSGRVDVSARVRSPTPALGLGFFIPLNLPLLLLACFC